MRKGKKRCHCKHKKRGGGWRGDAWKTVKRMGKSHLQKHGKKYAKKAGAYAKSMARKHGIEL